MNRKLTLSLAITLLAFTSLVTASMSYAWILTSYTFANIDNRPGDLDGLVTSKYWNISSAQTNKWEDFSLSVVPRHDFGEMDRIDQLPANSFSYYMFNFDETTDVNTNYFLMIEDIEIIIESEYEDPENELGDILYYDQTPDQAAFYYHTVRSMDANLNPTGLFSGEGTQISSKNQIISPIDLAHDEYVYIMLNIELEEIQNIINIIPLQFSPYTIDFEITFNVEKRSIDEY